MIVLENRIFGSAFRKVLVIIGVESSFMNLLILNVMSLQPTLKVTSGIMTDLLSPCTATMLINLANLFLLEQKIEHSPLLFYMFLSALHYP